MENSQYVDEIIKLSNGDNMITDGPLSLQYARALNELYKKDTDDATGIVLESQVNDEIVSRSLFIAAANSRKQLSNQGEDVGMLYGVMKSDVGISDVISITDTIGQMTEEEKQNSAIIIDTKIDVLNTGDTVIDNETVSVNPYIDTINQVAEENGVQVYPSLEAFVHSHKLKDGSYSGHQTGNIVKFKIGDKVHRHKTRVSVKGTDIKVSVSVKHGHVVKPA